MSLRIHTRRKDFTHPMLHLDHEPTQALTYRFKVEPTMTYRFKVEPTSPMLRCLMLSTSISIYLTNHHFHHSHVTDVWQRRHRHTHLSIWLVQGHQKHTRHSLCKDKPRCWSWSDVCPKIPSASLAKRHPCAYTHTGTILYTRWHTLHKTRPQALLIKYNMLFWSRALQLRVCAFCFPKLSQHQANPKISILCSRGLGSWKRRLGNRCTHLSTEHELENEHDTRHFIGKHRPRSQSGCVTWPKNTSAFMAKRCSSAYTNAGTILHTPWHTLNMPETGTHRRWEPPSTLLVHGQAWISILKCCVCSNFFCIHGKQFVSFARQGDISKRSNRHTDCSTEHIPAVDNHVRHC